MDAQTPALEVTSVVRSFRRSDGRVVHAVDDVSFDLKPGETLGLVGESGCGKSSLARALMQLPPPESGSVKISGKEITGLSLAERRNLRRRLQMVFQDPMSSLNPRRRIGDKLPQTLTIL
jgi:peptide/nickel transport system ATP-binding protein